MAMWKQLINTTHPYTTFEVDRVCQPTVAYCTSSRHGASSEFLGSCFWPPGEDRSNIHSLFTSVLVSTISRMLHYVHLLVTNFVHLVVPCLEVSAHWVYQGLSLKTTVCCFWKIQFKPHPSKSFKVVNKRAPNSIDVLFCMSKPDSTPTQLIQAKAPSLSHPVMQWFTACLFTLIADMCSAADHEKSLF